MRSAKISARLMLERRSSALMRDDVAAAGGDGLKAVSMDGGPKKACGVAGGAFGGLGCGAHCTCNGRPEVGAAGPKAR
ncbi:hypothetical protein GCM10022279_08850 [Comamonas faecalis]|uniref:Uncharacterized protein n=1 Tax=Comamonas faecalis TaxID=1387849 RepID=A0ABP7QW16_9BURK